MGTWERRNIAGSPPPHNSLGIFCWGRSFKIQREMKREVFLHINKCSSFQKEEMGWERGGSKQRVPKFLTCSPKVPNSNVVLLSPR
jgi:hypothetical protein